MAIWRADVDVAQDSRQGEGVQVGHVVGINHRRDAHKEPVKEETPLDERDMMDFFELASCSVHVTEGRGEGEGAEAHAHAADSAPDPFDEKLVCCLHCLAPLERQALGAHLAAAHGWRRVRLRCPSCHGGFRGRRELVAHRAACPRAQPAKRPKRKSVQQLVQELDRQQAPERKPVLACPVCMLQLPSDGLRAHLLSVHAGAGAGPCGLCGRPFKSRLTLREHMKLVHQARDGCERCDLCEQRFGSKKYLANHKRNVHPRGDQRCECRVCGKAFKSRLCLHQHAKHVHPPQSAAAGCPHPHCPKVFKSKTNLRQHLKVTHEGRRRPKL